LENWFASPAGLAMSQSDAAALASQKWQVLTQCDVTVLTLQALKNAMSDKLGLTLADVRQDILDLAEQHVVPDKLSNLFKALSSGYTLSGGLGLPKVEAQQRAIDMSKARAEVGQLYDLYKAMYGFQGLGFDQKTAQQLSIQQCSAGADAGTFKSQYQQALASGQIPQRALQFAVTASVNSNLEGVVRRYAKDAAPYTSQGFQQYYGEPGWLFEWLAAPMELRVSSDSLAHSAASYQRRFGSQWKSRYTASAEAIQMRLADDGEQYSMRDFQKYYGDAWQTRWAKAPELPCTVCAPYMMEAAPPDVVVV